MDSGDSPTDQPEWSYTGDTGPSNWSEMYQECAGQKQSPIDLTADDEIDPANVSMDYGEAEGRAYDTGKSVQVDLEGGTFTVGGKDYALKQFHFHTPGEHTVEGKTYPAEVHLVHAADDGTLAVLGMFYEEGEANEFLAPVWDALGSEDGSVTVDVGNMMPDDMTTFTYDGSLTTPPCSEVVSWFVLRQPLTMSAEQLEALKSIRDDNARPVQPRNEREIDRVEI